jgi:hypothetical protein
VKKYAHNVVSAIETNAKIDLSHQPLVTDQSGVLDVLGCFEDDGTATTGAFRHYEKFPKLNISPTGICRYDVTYPRPLFGADMAPLNFDVAAV